MVFKILDINYFREIETKKMSNIITLPSSLETISRLWTKRKYQGEIHKYFTELK